MTTPSGESRCGPGTKILYVITDLLVGGVPLHLHRLVLAMRARGLSPAVVSLAPPGPVADMMVRDGIAVHSCDGLGGWDFRVVGRLARLVRAVQPDVVHALLFHANLAARLAADQAGFDSQRLVCEIQTVEVERRWHLLLDRWTHRGCRLTIGNSPSVVEHLATHARIPRDRLRLVRGGIDPSRLRNVPAIDRTELGLADGTPVLLWTGRLDPVKGLETLIDAFKPVARETGAHLLLAGTGPIREQLVGRITRVGLKGRVHLLGARRDVPALLETADVFVFPSRTEGLPNALLEAMAAGCPIITTDVPGCRDLVRNEQSGLVVPFNDTEALTGAMIRLLCDRAWAARLGERAADDVQRHWHIHQTHDAYASLYREITA